MGAPSAERLHKASKAARRVALYTHVDPVLLRREAASRPVHKLAEIEVHRFAPALLDAIEAKMDRNTDLEIVRTDGRLYITIEGEVIEGDVARVSLVEGDP